MSVRRWIERGGWKNKAHEAILASVLIFSMAFIRSSRDQLVSGTVVQINNGLRIGSRVVSKPHARAIPTPPHWRPVHLIPPICVIVVESLDTMLIIVPKSRTNRHCRGRVAGRGHPTLGRWIMCLLKWHRRSQKLCSVRSMSILLLWPFFLILELRIHSFPTLSLECIAYPWLSWKNPS
jgi:hypothetical protein